MEQEPLQQIIDRSIQDNIIDGHAIDQDGSNVLIIGEEVHYCSDEGARKMLAILTDRAACRPEGMAKVRVGPKPLHAAA